MNKGDRMKKNIVLSLLLLFIASAAFAESAEGTKEYLVVNNPRIKRFSYSVGNVTIGNPNIVNFKADRNKNQVTLIPKSAGTTLLLVYDDRGVQRDAIELTVY